MSTETKGKKRQKKQQLREEEVEGSEGVARSEKKQKTTSSETDSTTTTTTTMDTVLDFDIDTLGTKNVAAVAAATGKGVGSNHNHEDVILKKKKNKKEKAERKEKKHLATSPIVEVVTAAAATVSDKQGEEDTSAAPATFKKTRRSKRGGGAAGPPAGGALVQDVVYPSSSSGKFGKRKMDQHDQEEEEDTSIAFVTGSKEGGQGKNGEGLPQELDPETRSYFVEIEKKLFELEQEDEEQRSLLIENVYREMVGKEAILACDYETSRILERLFKISFDFQVKQFALVIQGSYKMLMMNQFASHVCQCILNQASEIVERELKGTVSQAPKEDGVEVDDAADKPAPLLPAMEDIILDIVKELSTMEEDQQSSFWVAFLVHPQGSHVLRTLLNLLSGQSLVDPNQIRSKKSINYNINHNTGSLNSLKRNVLVPSSFSGKLKELVEVINSSIQDDLKRLSTHPIGNPVIQLIVSLPEYGELTIKTLFDIGEENTMNTDSISFAKTSLIQDKVGSHLMQKILEHSSPSVYKILYQALFAENILALSLHPISNFVVQSLISNTQEQSQYEEILAVLLPQFESLIFGTGSSRTGIVVKVVERAISYPTLQKRCVDGILTAFHAMEPARRNDLANLVLNMRTYENFQQRIFVNKPQTNGSLILQHILCFTAEQARPFYESISTMPRTQLDFWISDPGASRILESLLVSASIPHTVKRALIGQFLGSFSKLACDKFGSHFVDKCWSAANIDLKTQIATELAQDYQKLLASFHAKFILRNCGIELFRKRKEEWLQHQKGLRQLKKSANKKAKDEIDEIFN